jgi:hypothetical protein
VYGYTSDDLFAGKFMPSTQNDPASGNVRFDKLGAYGRVGTNTYRWLIDTDNDGVADINQEDFQKVNGLPVAGNFDQQFAGDEVGLFTGSTWYFDTNHNFQVDESLNWSIGFGHGVVGDFDGDGFDDLATYSNDVWSFDLSSIGPTIHPDLPGLSGNGSEQTIKFGFIGTGERPVVADMNQDGIEDVGLWVPAREGVTPREQSEWYFLISGVVANDTAGAGNPPLGQNIGPTITGGADPTPGSYLAVGAPLNSYGVASYANGRVVTDPLFPNADIVRFQPVPFGPDQYFQYGDEFALPLVGNFDPPVTSGTVQNTVLNSRNGFDVTNDGRVNAQDILALANFMIANGAGPVPPAGEIGSLFYDVTNDFQINAQDILGVINYMIANPPSQQSGSGEGEAVDAFFADSDADRLNNDELYLLLATDGGERD